MNLERRLQEFFASADRGMPRSVVDWDETIADARRGRVVRVALVAAAAILIAGGAAWYVNGSLAADPIRTPDLAPANSPDEAPSPNTSPTSAEAGSDAGIVRPRMLDWVKAISLGDTATAWSGLAPRSKSYFDNDISKFELLMPALQEGWGTWYDGVEGEPQTDTRVMVSAGTEAGGVITLYGEITREGGTSFQANAVPFRITDGEALLDPFSSKIEIMPLQSLASRNPRFPSDVLPYSFLAEVPPDIAQVNFFVAGDEGEVEDASLQTKESEDTQPPNLVARAEYDALLVRGTYALTIAAIDANGGIATRTLTFVTD
ncbi:MAG TPA: hypothetical protein VJ927_11880 [Actinomycetota bacterium]|nr:hypothetical protein [Actinomycetota bacterium]